MSEKIRVLLSEEEVDARIQEVADVINKDYEGKDVHMICVLKGGVFFMCELAKRITRPVTLDFMSVSSYGDDTKSSGVVKIVKDLDQPLEGKDVLIVEDIIDSGRTLSYLLRILKGRHPASIKLCTLLDNTVKSLKSSATDKQNVFSIYLYELLMWVLSATLWRHIGHTALYYLKKRLLYALTAYISCDRNVLRFS